MWKEDANVQIQNYSRRHIKAVMNSGKSGKEWRFMDFYGNPEVAKRPESWALLRCLSRIVPDPWLCVGDFNEIISSSKKFSSAYRPPRQMQEFQRALDDSNLTDLGFSGPRFT
jgi:hypothetical protein